MSQNKSKVDIVYSALIRITAIEGLPKGERTSAQNIRAYNENIYQLENTSLSPRELIELYKKMENYQKGEAKDTGSLLKDEVAAHAETKSKLRDIIDAAGPINALAKAIAKASED